MSEVPAATAAAPEAPPEESKAVAKIGARPVAMGARGADIRDSSDLWTLAKIMAHGRGMVDPLPEKPNAIVLAKRDQAYFDCAVLIQAGAEAGMTPVMATQALYVTEGRIGWMAKGALARLRSAGLLPTAEDAWVPRYENMPPPGTPLDKWPGDAKCVISFRRMGWAANREAEFTVDDARTAGLWNKSTRSGNDTPWTRTPKRMLQARCAGFIFTDYFSDGLLCLPIKEELQDVVRLEREARGDQRPAVRVATTQAPATFAAAIVVDDDVQDAEVVAPKDEPEQAATPAPPAPIDIMAALKESLASKAPTPAEAPTAAPAAVAEERQPDWGELFKAEVGKRTGGDDAAMADVLREASRLPATPEEFDTAMLWLRQHPAFGDPAEIDAQAGQRAAEADPLYREAVQRGDATDQPARRTMEESFLRPQEQPKPTKKGGKR